MDSIETLQLDFEQNGYAILPGFYGTDEVGALQKVIDDLISQPRLDLCVDDMDSNARTLLGWVKPSDRQAHRFKFNDLFLISPEVRDVATNPRISRLLERLVGQRLALCNSLYFEKGSAQALHVDSLYMTPRTQGDLIAIWVALEDAHPDAGPLEYYPGSHLIPQFRFSDGSYHATAGEMLQFETYMRKEVQSRGLQKNTFPARRGDVFIWHAHLFHGGGAINDLSRTRRSLVFHYYSERDCKTLGIPVQRETDERIGWQVRPRQGVPIPKHVNFDVDPFPEQDYLLQNPDVAAAVRAGTVRSGRAHFDRHGKHENRLI